MNRFFVEKDQIEKDAIRVVDSDDVRHLLKVLRIRPGEELFVSDGEGQGYLAVFQKKDGQAALFSIKERRPFARREDRPIFLTIGCAVPKAAKFEEIVDKAVQLGADTIVPLWTERTLADKALFIRKKDRYERVLRMAAKQSGALFLPRLKKPLTFNAFISRVADFDLCLLPNLSKKSRSMKEALSDFRGRRLAVMIGPEGDFSPGEIDAALKAGCVGISLGESVLRIDTAAIAVMSFIRLFFEKDIP
jgi:16S rRNA (uracil1498-N3)-methyltransferase